jgi:hypothetical protein
VSAILSSFCFLFKQQKYWRYIITFYSAERQRKSLRTPALKYAYKSVTGNTTIAGGKFSLYLAVNCVVQLIKFQFSHPSAPPLCLTHTCACRSLSTAPWDSSSLRNLRFEDRGYSSCQFILSSSIFFTVNLWKGRIMGRATGPLPRAPTWMGS